MAPLVVPAFTAPADAGRGDAAVRAGGVHVTLHVLEVDAAVGRLHPDLAVGAGQGHAAVDRLRVHRHPARDVDPVIDVDVHLIVEEPVE